MTTLSQEWYTAFICIAGREHEHWEHLDRTAQEWYLLYYTHRN